MFTQLNQYHVVLEVKPSSSTIARRTLRRTIYVHSAELARQGAAQRASRTVEQRRRPADDQSPGPIPGRHALVQPGAGRFAGRRRRRDRQAPRTSSACRQHPGRLSRHGRGVSGSLTNEPMLILAALITVYIVLGVLYESYIHPITILSTLPSAGVGAILALLSAARTSA